MLFLVDGYNITKGDPATSALSLEEQREALVARLRARGGSLLGRGRIIVVFDGEAGMAHTAAASSFPVEIVFSRGAPADDVIVSLAEAAGGEQLCLVTSDSGIVDRARSRARASVDVRPRESVYEAAQGRRKAARSGVPRDVGFPPGANGITEELKQTWLKGEE